MIMPSVSLKSGQMACCPTCKRDQGDPIQDYFSSGRRSLTEPCGWCERKLRLVDNQDGTYSITEVKTLAHVLGRKMLLS